MRFDELHLLKYGNFEGCDLTFPRQPIDFHVIFGANEAGKSTTLAAVGDLLFGFPHGISQNYRFDASLLRVGGVLEQGVERTQVRRKRGRGVADGWPGHSSGGDCAERYAARSDKGDVSRSLEP